MKIRIIILIVFIVTNLCGCGIVRGIYSGIAGHYMGGLEEARENSVAKVFNYSIDECFDKVLAILDSEAIDAIVLKIDRRNYKIMTSVSRPLLQDVDESVFYANNVDVGLFFTQEEQQKTKLEIVSLSSLFVEHTAEKIFAEL